MNKKKKIEELRDRLNNIINENLDYNEILALSQELDVYIVEAMKKEMEMLEEDKST